MATQPRKRSKKPTHRLVELDVQEVSLVDRPANQKPFLIVKCEGGLTEAEEMARRTAVAASEATAAKPRGIVIEIDGEGFDPLDLASDDPEPTTKDDDGEDDAPPPDDAGADEADSEGDDAGTAEGGSDGDDEPAEPVVKAVAHKLTSEALTRLMDTVNAISKADAIEDAHAAELRDIAKALDPEAIADDVEADDARKVTTDALSKLMTTTNLIKALDDEIDSLPDAITKSITEIATNLNGAAAASKGDEGSEEDTPEPETPQLVVYKSARADGDIDLVIKRGAKMKTSRLSKLKEASAMLTKLIEELEGEAASDGGKKKTQKSDDDTGTPPAVDTAAIVEQVTGEIKKTIADTVKTINETMNGLKGEIDAVTKRMDEADGEVPDGNADDDGEAEPTQKKDDASFNNILGITG